MPLPGVYFNPKRPFRYDADSLTFFSQITGAGGVLTTREKMATDQLIRDLKYSGAWYKCIALYPFVGGSSVAHQFNLKAPGQYSLTFYGSPTHSANGTYFGPGQYARTGITSAANLEKTNQHWSVYNRSASVLDGNIHVMVSDEIVQSTFDWITGAFGNTVIFQLCALQANIVTSDAVGFLMANRVDGSDITTVINEDIQTIIRPVSATQNTSEICIGHTNGRDGNFECAGVSLGQGMTASEITAFKDALNTFQSTLLR